MVIIIDEISMVLNKLLLYIHQRLCDIFGTDENVPFAGISILVCGDLHRLPPIQQSPVFGNYKDEILNIDHCWKYFLIAELTQVMRQRGDETFIDLLNMVREGNLTDQDAKLLKSRFIEPDNENYSSDAIHIWAENHFVNEHNKKKTPRITRGRNRVDYN